MEIQALSPEIIQDTQPQSHATTTNSIPTDLINSTFSSTCIDLIAAPLSSRILSFSDEFFAPASNLLNPLPPIYRPGVFIATGAWYDGWETRRHNPKPYDWVVIKLGVASGRVRGVEIDTAFFTGNYAEAVSVQGCFESGDGADEKVMGEEYEGWKEVLGRRTCGPSQRHGWRVEGGMEVTHVKLCMFPDGGIARFRLYGEAVPVWPQDAEEVVELSAAVMGGVAIACSDEHFGRKGNLLLPGRGKDMGDGWETKRSRGKDHVDWVVVRLGARGRVSRVVLDTRHFIGNFPQGVKVEGCDIQNGEETPGPADRRWTEMMGTEKLGPDELFEFKGEQIRMTNGQTYSHVRMTMIPDGGVKRFRIFDESTEKDEN
ncbi:MAG: hypothetical protein Q9195_003940 [Heterodermia aff. obscurata]